MGRLSLWLRFVSSCAQRTTRGKEAKKVSGGGDETNEEGELTIPKLPFRRLAQEIGQEFMTDVPLEEEALDVLQTAAEVHMVSLFRQSLAEGTSLSAAFEKRTAEEQAAADKERVKHEAEQAAQAVPAPAPAVGKKRGRK